MICLAQLLSAVIAFKVQPDWRMMVGLAGLPSLVQLIGMFFMPESPRWLAKVGRSAESRKVLELVYKDEHVEAEDRALTEEV